MLSKKPEDTQNPELESHKATERTVHPFFEEERLQRYSSSGTNDSTDHTTSEEEQTSNTSRHRNRTRRPRAQTPAARRTSKDPGAMTRGRRHGDDLARLRANATERFPSEKLSKRTTAHPTNDVRSGFLSSKFTWNAVPSLASTVQKTYKRQAEFKDDYGTKEHERGYTGQ